MAPTMEVPKVVHMNEGEGEASYHRNSVYQTNLIVRARPILEESIEEICRANMGECLRITEMGCSTGPNTLLPLWEVAETIEGICSEQNKKPPVLQVFLNDLPGTDFNMIFKSIVPEFQNKLEQKMGKKFEDNCFIGAMPGSFYGRLFPPNFIHFGHSCSSLHWISQVPDGLVNESGIQLNKDNICVAETSPPSVRKAYLSQFEKDFTSFLKFRSEEMVSGGRFMFIIFVQSGNPHSKFGNELWQELGFALKQMVDEGVIEKSKFESWNIPLYHPAVEEVKHLIEKEGSFTISRLEQFELSWDSIVDYGDETLITDKLERGKCVANFVRAAAESMIISHFGDSIIDEVFNILSFRMVDRLQNGTGWLNNLVVSITRK